MYDDAYTRNEDGELAVRTVNVTEGSNSSSYDEVFTRDTNGKLALRVVGSGGGDSHNKGYFATLADLQEAYPTGEAGDYAIVGATDTVWLWDEDTSAWKDSDTKGQVTSVNGQTGDVSLSIPDAVQYSTMPTASADNLSDIVQFTGTTDANYTNGYFYKCVSDGQEPATYSWTRVDVQPTPDPLPSQTGNSGKFLTTDGTDASWSDKPLVNNTAQTASLAIKGSTSALGTIAIGDDSGSTQQFAISIGNYAKAQALGAIQLGGHGVMGQRKNTDANTFKVGNANGNFEIMSADGTVPTDRLTKVNTTATLAVADWSSSTQTVTVSGVKADSVVFVSPAPASASDYASAGILCTAQAADSLTFTCTTTPTNAITVNVICL